MRLAVQRAIGCCPLCKVPYQWRQYSELEALQPRERPDGVRVERRKCGQCSDGVVDVAGFEEMAPESHWMAWEQYRELHPQTSFRPVLLPETWLDHAVIAVEQLTRWQLAFVVLAVAITLWLVGVLLHMLESL